ncbi:O-antigen ligase family protein [Dermacoccaceae bacterium W4C1]
MGVGLVAVPVVAFIIATLWFKPGHAASRALIMSAAMTAFFAAQSAGSYANGALAAMGGVCLYAWSVDGKVTPTKTPLRLLTLIWWTYVPVASYMFSDLRLPRFILLLPVLAILATTTTRLKPDGVREFFAGYLFLCVFEVVFGWFLYLTNQRGPWVPSNDIDRINPLPGVEGQVRVMGTLQHPIPYSMLLVLGLLVLLANPVRWRLPSRIIVGLALISGIYISGSRSAFLAMIFGVAVYALATTHILRLIRNAVLLGAATLAGMVLIGSTVRSLAQGLESSGSYEQRQSSINALPALLRREDGFWFGSGFSNTTPLYDRGLIYSPFEFRIIDNWFVFLLGTAGMVGFLVFSACYLLLFIRSDRLGKSFLASMGAYFMSFDVFNWLISDLLLVILAGVAMTGKYLAKQAGESPPDSGQTPEHAGSERVDGIHQTVSPVGDRLASSRGDSV